ncbi:MAG: oligoendopeptidase F [Clostridia bacterium]
MELKSRDQLDPTFTWDLSPIFSDDTSWKKALEKVSGEIEGLTELSGQLDGCAHCLKRVLDKAFEVEYDLFLVYVYAMLKNSSDNGNQGNQAMLQMAMQEYVKYEANLSFLVPEILAIPEDRFKDEYQNNEILEKYRHFMDNVNRSRAHTLTSNEEHLLAMMGDAQNGPSRSIRMLSDVDLRFPTVKNENGEEIELSHARFSVLRESQDRNVRKAAFDGFLGEYKKFNNTISAIYQNSIMFDKFNALARKHPSSCEAALFSSNVPISVYDSLVSAVHDSLPTMRRYIDLRKRVLKLDTVSLYDLYCPMVLDVDFKVTFEEGKELVKKALAPLGEKYIELLNRAFSEHWLDVYENRGKTSGAFSCGVYGVHSYVLLNYADKLDDAFTLAHEMGHAMHSYLSNSSLDYANSGYKIFVAEVASTVNEVLLSKYLLKVEKDKKRRAFILNHLLECFRTTVFRQTLFAEFERKAHDMAEAGTPITGETLNKVYHDLNSLYYAGAENPEIFDYEWSWINHFYNAFYVYQYATGFSSAVAIADGILATGETSGYLKFLSSGGSDYPIELLKGAGVDLTTPAPIKTALKFFDETVLELDALLSDME